jgi:hypothetical protein
VLLARRHTGTLTDVENLVVIDLVSQQDAVRKHVAGWSCDSIADWLAQFGEVEEVRFRDPAVPRGFVFVSASGRHAKFSVRPDGYLWISP